MKNWRIVLAIIFFSALTLVIGLGYDYFRFTRQPLTIPKDGLVYELRPGTSVIRIANEMVAAGYLEHRHYFRLLAHYQGDTRALKAGEYELN